MRQQKKRVSFHFRRTIASNTLAFPPTATKATVSTHLISLRNNKEFITVERREEEAILQLCEPKSDFIITQRILQQHRKYSHSPLYAFIQTVWW